MVEPLDLISSVLVQVNVDVFKFHIHVSGFTLYIFSIPFGRVNASVRRVYVTTVVSLLLLTLIWVVWEVGRKMRGCD